MDNKPKNSYLPDVVSAPGETLAEVLEERGMKQSEFASRTGRPDKTISEIIHGKAQITSDTALQFQRVLGIPAGFWIQREANFREYLARQEETKAFAAQVPWLDRLPISYMRKEELISKGRDKVQTVRDCLSFFGVSSSAVWENVYGSPIVAFRRQSVEMCDIGATSVWMRRGELAVSGREFPVYNRNGFKAALVQIRSSMREAPREYGQKIQNLCAQAGVAVVFVPKIPGARVSGITRWLSSDLALIQLSLFGATDDKFWFTFYHEAAHILLHRKSVVFCEGDAPHSDEELEANKFAGDFMISQLDMARLKAMNLNASELIPFAREIGVPPGVVVGRLQHEGLLGYKTPLNKLKASLEIRAGE